MKEKKYKPSPQKHSTPKAAAADFIIFDAAKNTFTFVSAIFIFLKR